MTKEIRVEGRSIPGKREREREREEKTDFAKGKRSFSSFLLTHILSEKKTLSKLIRYSGVARIGLVVVGGVDASL